MRNTLYNKTFLLSLIILLCSGFIQAQDDETVKTKRSIEAFSEIEVSDAFNITYKQSDTYSLFIETNERYIDDVISEEIDGILTIHLEEDVKPTLLNLYISSPDIEKIVIRGASEFYSEGVIDVDYLEIKASGATRVDARVNVRKLKTRASGVAEIYLRGEADRHDLYASNGSKVIASQLFTNNTDVESRGSAKVRVNATEDLRLLVCLLWLNGPRRNSRGRNTEKPVPHNY